MRYQPDASPYLLPSRHIGLFINRKVVQLLPMAATAQTAVLPASDCTATKLQLYATKYVNIKNQFLVSSFIVTNWMITKNQFFCIQFRDEKF